MKVDYIALAVSALAMGAAVEPFHDPAVGDVLRRRDVMALVVDPEGSERERDRENPAGFVTAEQGLGLQRSIPVRRRRRLENWLDFRAVLRPHQIAKRSLFKLVRRIAEELVCRVVGVLDLAGVVGQQGGDIQVFHHRLQWRRAARLFGCAAVNEKDENRRRRYRPDGKPPVGQHHPPDAMVLRREISRDDERRARARRQQSVAARRNVQAGQNQKDIGDPRGKAEGHGKVEGEESGREADCQH